MSDSGDLESLDSSDWEIVDPEPVNKSPPVTTHTDRGVCYSIKFFDGPGGERYVPEHLIEKHTDFAALFDKNKHLDCSPVSRATASVVMSYLKRGRLPGPNRNESERSAVIRLFRRLIMFREDAPRIKLQGLQELNVKGITQLLEKLTILDMLEVATKEREWRLAETDDMLIKLLTLRICAQTEVVPVEAFTVMDNFCNKVADVKWDVVKAMISIMVDYQRLKNKDRAMILERCKASED
ncbi:hypothetical protein ACHAPO_000600 [Fusarium lateritium]